MLEFNAMNTKHGKIRSSNRDAFKKYKTKKKINIRSKVAGKKIIHYTYVYSQITNDLYKKVTSEFRLISSYHVGIIGFSLVLITSIKDVIFFISGVSSKFNKI